MSKRAQQLVVPDILVRAMSVLELRGYKLRRAVLGDDIDVVRPDGTAVGFAKLLADSAGTDFTPDLHTVLDEAVGDAGFSRTQRGRYRRHGVSSSSTLQQAARRVYRDQRAAIAAELERTTDVTMLAAAGQVGSYSKALLNNPLSPSDAIDRIAEAQLRRDQDEARQPLPLFLDRQFTESIYKHPALSERMIRRLYRDRTGLNRALASHPALPEDLQRTYLKTAQEHPAHVFLLEHLAANPSLQPDMLGTIFSLVEQAARDLDAYDRDDWRFQERVDEDRNDILLALATNPSTPTTILRRFAAADEPELDAALARNPRLGAAVDAEEAERIRLESQENVIAARDGHVIHGDLDYLARYWRREIAVSPDGDRFNVGYHAPDAAFELRGGVIVPLPDTEEIYADEPRPERMLRYRQRAGEADPSILRRQVRSLLEMWPAPYEQALHHRQNMATERIENARASYEHRVQSAHKDLLEALVLAVNDGADLESAAERGGVSRDELHQAVRRARRPTLVPLSDTRRESAGDGSLVVSPAM